MKHFKFTNIYLGDQYELSKIPKNWYKIHVGSKFFPNSKELKIYIDGNEMFVNWEDSSDENDFKTNDLIKILDFIYMYKNQNLFIHCEYAQSRSPAVLMAYLAKRTKILPDNFFDALEEFVKMYPKFVYPSGITKFLKTNWTLIK
ncbi:MAG: dual specificity protein phosphatase family protein [candidate division SR1 bacterium]|nr:dual specificity protein phosphatase family protein [candidate division SR1 bacterium]